MRVKVVNKTSMYKQFD